MNTNGKQFVEKMLLKILVFLAVFLVAVLIPYIGGWSIYSDVFVFNMELGMVVCALTIIVIMVLGIVYNEMYLAHTKKQEEEGSGK